MDGDVGDVQNAGAEVVEAGGVADGKLRPLCGKVGAGVAVDGDDFVLRAEGGVFRAAAVEDVGQGGVVAVLFEPCAEVGCGGGRFGWRFGQECAAVSARLCLPLQSDAYGGEEFGEGQV